jgi:hypothetical protein
MAYRCTISLTIRRTAEQHQDAADDLLPPYTREERMRELCQRLVLLRWRVQRLRLRSTPLLPKQTP